MTHFIIGLGQRTRDAVEVRPAGDGEAALREPDFGVDMNGRRACELFEEELGDVLFAAVKVGRFCGVDPEAALTKTCEKFIARFRKVEETVNARGEDMSALPLDELMALWNDAKEQLR